MSRTILAACGVLAIASLTAMAQTPQTARPGQTTPPSGSDSTLTLTGCLKPWSESMMGGGAITPNPESGAPATPTTNAADAQYVLTDIDDSSRKPGSTASGSTPNPQVMYLLKPKDPTINLGQHVNHKIQVTGTLSSDSTRSGSLTPSPMAQPRDPAKSPTRDTSPTSAAGKPATITVSAITMVSSSCSTTR